MSRSKRERPALRLPKSEVELIAKLQSWSGEERPVAFLTRLLRVRKIEDGIFEVPSAHAPEKTYRVNLTNRTCPCESFTFRKRCIHYKLAHAKNLIERG